MILLDGKKIAQDIRAELKTKIEKLKAEGKNVPGLVAILVGNNPASEIYVKSKTKDCNEIGMRTMTEKRDADISENELIELIQSYNHNKDYHGILVQLPLPKHIDEDKIIKAISPNFCLLVVTVYLPGVIISVFMSLVSSSSTPLLMLNRVPLTVSIA